MTLTQTDTTVWLTACEERDILDYQPAEVVDMALERLQKAGVELIEWRSLLYRRMGVPIIVRNYAYLVQDERLDQATEILSEMRLPFSKPSRCLLRTGGDFQAKGHFHRITRATSPGFVQHLVLYPLSFSTLSWSEVYKMPPYYDVPTPRCKSVYVPSPPALYASLIRMMHRYPHQCSTVPVLHSDISELIDYDLFQLQLEDGYVNPEDGDECERMPVDRKLASGTEKVMGWNNARLWRVGEEWIGDALYAIVGGTGTIECLSWKS